MKSLLQLALLFYFKGLNTENCHRQREGEKDGVLSVCVVKVRERDRQTDAVSEPVRETVNE